MPRNPQKCTQVLEHLLLSKRRKAINSCSTVQPSTVKGIYRCLREVKSALRKKLAAALPRQRFLKNLVSKLRSKYKVKAKDISEGLGISWTETKRFSQENVGDIRKRRSDATDQSTVQSVTDFLCRPDNSIELPDKKSVGASLLPRRVAHRSLSKLYTKWKEENPSKNIGFIKFTQITTRVKTQAHRATIQCLCEYCTNVTLKIKAIHPIACRHKVNLDRFKDKYEVAESTLCPYESRYAQLKCIDRKCERCGPSLLANKLRQVVELSKDTCVTWRVWEYADSSLTKGKKRVLVTKTTSMEVLVQMLLDDIKPFTAHLFHAQWQHDQYNLITHNIPENSVIMVMDFSENYSCFYQEEIQSAHWAKNVVTIHPIVTYYECPEHKCIIREYLDFISHDSLHDSHAVATFVDLAISHLRNKRGLSINRVIQFTDGASSQYKSRGPFCDISYSKFDHKAIVERHFFGSRHGKGPCDGEGGVLKSAVTRAVKNGEAVISNASEFYNFCNTHLCKPLHNAGDRICEGQQLFARSLFLVENINHSRHGRDGSTVVGTRQLHCVRGGLEPGKLFVRRLSCFCGSCEDGVDCNNQAYVQHLRAVTVKTQDEGTTDDFAPIEKPCADHTPLEQLSNGDAPSNQDVLPWKCGDWVVVNYSGTHYPGIVSQIISTNTEVDCMEKSGRFWRWPVGWPAQDKKDLLWYSRENVIKIVTPPIPVSNRGQ